MTASGRATRDAFAAFVGFGRGIWLFPLDTMFRTVGLRYGWLKALFTAAPPPLIRGIGLLRAERAAWRASRRVPAYGRYLEESGVDVASLFPLGILRHLPETDKKSYVDRYGLLERCVGGAVPYPGTTIDESSGSTGTPYNWIRGRQGTRGRPSQHRVLRALRVRDRAARDDQRVLDGRVGRRHEHEHRDDAPRHRQVGRARRRQDPLDARLSRPDVSLPDLGLPAVPQAPPRRGRAARLPVGRLRAPRAGRRRGHDRGAARLLLARFASVYSGYGATDIEIGMAGESPVSIAVRRLARARPDIGRALFGPDSRLPMVFQYNPLIHYMEVNALGEVICTVSRLDLLAPRIRYNVHDSGGIVEFAKVARVLRTFGFDLDRLGESPEVHGRAARCRGRNPSRCRSSGSTAGATRRSASWARTSTPRTSRPSLYRDPLVAPRLHSFMLSVVDDETGTPRPAVAIELANLEGVDDAWRLAAAERLRDGLGALNIDYRSSLGEFPGAMLPIVSTYAVGDGPFAADATRIKQRRIGLS